MLNHLSKKKIISPSKSKLLMKNFMMLTSICSLDWTKGCPDSWQTLFLDISVRVFPKDISIWIHKLSRRSPSPMSAGIIQSVECQNKENKKVGTGEFAFLAWAGTPIFSCPWTPELLVLEFSALDQNYSINFLGSQPSGLRPNYTIRFPWPLPCTQQVVGLLDFHNLVKQFL